MQYPPVQILELYKHTNPLLQNTGICLYAGSCDAMGGSFDYLNPCATPAWPEPIECCVKIGCPDNREGFCAWPENCNGTTQSYVLLYPYLLCLARRTNADVQYRAGQCLGGQVCCL